MDWFLYDNGLHHEKVKGLSMKHNFLYHNFFGGSDFNSWLSNFTGWFSLLLEILGNMNVAILC